MGMNNSHGTVARPVEHLPGMLRRWVEALAGRLRANRVAPALSGETARMWGVGSEWRPLSYGEYYPRSVPVYAAIRLRGESIARTPLVVHRPAPGSGGEVPAGPDHPMQRLLDMPNPFWTRGDLWRATETYLGLWGSAFWGLERDGSGAVSEIWPLRPDRVRVLPDPTRYVRGFVYGSLNSGAPVPYVPEDVVWFRYFNPLDEYAGLSPMAPLRLSADMGMDALKANRASLGNESLPGLVIETSDYPTDDEVREFYDRWESRFKGANRSRRPALLSKGMRATNLGFSPRDMEYVHSLRWSLEDVSRTYGVPKLMLGDMERATFSNFRTARRVFWEDTVLPQLSFYEEALQQMLVGPASRGERLRVRFDIGAIEALRENENDRASRRTAYVQAGIMTVDEARAELGLPGKGEVKGGGRSGGPGTPAPE